MLSLALVIFCSLFGVLCLSLLISESEDHVSYTYKHTGRNRGFRRSTRTITQKVGDLSIQNDYPGF